MPRFHVRLIALLSIPVLILMSGCVRMKADYEILSESKVQVSMDIGMRNDAVAEFGQEVPDFCEDTSSLDVLGVPAEEYTDEGAGGYSGCRLAGTAPISELNDGNITLTLDDDIWTFGMEGSSGDTEGMTADMLSDFQIRVTFPGEVLTHSGGSTLEGTTVTWVDPGDLFTTEGLKATAENSGGFATPAWLWPLLGALVVIGAVVAIILLQRKKQRVQTQPHVPWQGAYGPGPQYPPQSPGPQYPPQAPGPQYPPSQPSPPHGTP